MQKFICNSCGKELKTQIDDQGKQIVMEDYLKVQKAWGYFSHKDEEIHEFILCEACYDKMISHFAKCVDVKSNLELL